MGTWLLAPKELGLQEIPQSLADELRRELLAPLHIRLSSPTKDQLLSLGGRKYLLQLPR